MPHEGKCYLNAATEHNLLYLGWMLVKILLSMAFVTHAVVGSFCMIPMAMPSDMPMSHDMHASATMMTPIAPMSRTDCDHCPHHEEKKAVSQQSSSCAGHCLSQATANTQGNVVIGSAQLLAVLPTAIPIQWGTTEDLLLQPNINASPPFTSTNSVVLRL